MSLWFTPHENDLQAENKSQFFYGRRKEQPLHKFRKVLLLHARWGVYALAGFASDREEPIGE